MAKRVRTVEYDSQAGGWIARDPNTGATSYRYGVIRTLDEARVAAAEAEAEGLLGYYPAACVVLERELKRWEAAHAAWLELEEMRRHGNADDATEAAAHLERVKHAAHGVALPDGAKNG